MPQEESGSVSSHQPSGGTACGEKGTHLLFKHKRRLHAECPLTAKEWNTVRRMYSTYFL